MRRTHKREGEEQQMRQEEPNDEQSLQRKTWGDQTGGEAGAPGDQTTALVL